MRDLRIQVLFVLYPHVFRTFAAPIHSELGFRVNERYHSILPEQTAEDRLEFITPFPTYAIVLLTLFVLICAFGSAIIFKLLYPLSMRGWKSHVSNRAYSPFKSGSSRSGQHAIVNEASLHAGICAPNNGRSSPASRSARIFFGVDGCGMSRPLTSSLFPLSSGSFQHKQTSRSEDQSLQNALHFRLTSISSSSLLPNPRTQASSHSSQSNNAPAITPPQSSPSKAVLIFSYLKALIVHGQEKRSTATLLRTHVVTHSSRDVLQGDFPCILAPDKAPESTLQSAHSENHSLTSHSPVLSISPSSGVYSLCEPQLSAGSVLQSFLDFSSPFISQDAFITTAAEAESEELNVDISGPRYLHGCPLETISEETDDNNGSEPVSQLSTRVFPMDTNQEHFPSRRPDNMKCLHSFSTTSSIVSSACLLRRPSEEHLELFCQLQSTATSNSQSFLPDIPDESPSAYHTDTISKTSSETCDRSCQYHGFPAMQSASPISVYASHPVLSAVSALRSPNVNRESYTEAWQQPVIRRAVKNLEAKSISPPELDQRHKMFDMGDFENLILPRIENADQNEKVPSFSSTRNENVVSERLFIGDTKATEFSSGVSHSTFHSALSSFPMSRHASAETRSDSLEDYPIDKEEPGSRVDFQNSINEGTLISTLRGLSTPRSIKDDVCASPTDMLSPSCLSPASSTAPRVNARTILPPHRDSIDPTMKNENCSSILREKANQEQAKEVLDSPNALYPVKPNYSFASPIPLASLRPLLFARKPFPRSLSPASSIPLSPDPAIRHVSSRLMVSRDSFSFDCLVSTPMSSPEFEFTPDIDPNSPSVRSLGQSYMLPIQLDIHRLGTFQVATVISSPTSSLNE